MTHGKARRNERNLIRTDFEYNYTADSFKGVDFSAPDGRCDDEHFACLVNLYRDKQKKDGAALESIPGYRMIAKEFENGGEIYGIYSHSFWMNGKSEAYVLVHKGEYLYGFVHQRRDIPERLVPIATLAARRSCGFAYGDCFYILDGENLLMLKSPFEAVVLGDRLDMTTDDEMKDTEAYIPLILRDGVAYEERNMMTGFFDIEKCVKPEEISQESQGLFYRECFYGQTRGLEVYGMEEGRRIVAIPDRADLDGEELPVLAVAPDAFKARNIRMAVLAPSVKVIGEGAFSGCDMLERVLIYGSPAIKKDAFFACSAIKHLAVENPVMSVNETAFDGCDSVLHVYLPTASNMAWLDRFEETAAFHPYTLFFWKEVGETIYIPCDSIGYTGFDVVYGAETEALKNFKSYFGIESEAIGLNEGFMAKAANTAPYVQYYMKGEGVQSPSRYIFASVFDALGRINTRDDIEAFLLPLPDYAKRLVSVDLNGEALGVTGGDGGAYYATEYANGKRIGLRILLPRKRKADAKLTVRCYGAGRSEAGGGFYAMNPRYTKNMYEAICACRFATVFDGKVFLAGNPDLPDTVFYSVTPKRESEFLTFAPTAYLACRDTVGEVLGFAVHPLYLAILKERSLYGVTRKSKGSALHECYEIDGWCASSRFLGGTFTYQDEPLFLSEGGVMALQRGKAWQEGRMENRSYYIDGLLRKLSADGGSFCEWNGYLVLLTDGKIFLGDASIADKKDGVLAYEWYYLEGMGHYDGDALCYHYLSHDPIVRGKRLSTLTVNGRKLHILGKEDAVCTEVDSAIAEDNGLPSDITVYYTVVEENGEQKYYLVDSHGEKEGGFLAPATRIHSVAGCLYFASEDGYLFCFNTDKRGKSALINDSLQSVAEDAIHPSYYSFDGHAYSSVLITANVDMGIPHLLKRTVPKSLVVRAKAMPHAACRVAVRQDGDSFQTVGVLVTNEALLYPDADRFVFSPVDSVSEVFADASRNWISKQVMIAADVFESPIAFDAVAYRYKMAGRVKSQTK